MSQILSVRQKADISDVGIHRPRGSAAEIHHHGTTRLQTAAAALDERTARLAGGVRVVLARSGHAQRALFLAGGSQLFLPLFAQLERLPDETILTPCSRAPLRRQEEAGRPKWTSTRPWSLSCSYCKWSWESLVKPYCPKCITWLALSRPYQRCCTRARTHECCPQDFLGQ